MIQYTPGLAPGNTVALTSRPMTVMSMYDECVLIKSIRTVGGNLRGPRTFLVRGICEHGADIEFTVSEDLQTVGMPVGMGFGVVPGLSVETVPATVI